ncbi:hypothetical protein ABE527_17785 [Brucella sp. TWI432]
MTMSPPLLSRDVFIKLHTALEAKIRKLTLTPSGRYKLCETGIDNLMREGAKSLKATNTAARMNFAENSHDLLDDQLRKHPRTKLSFVTLAPRECCVPIDGDHDRAIDDLQILLYEQFGGFSFYGFIEPSLFANFPITPNNKKTIAWHVHMLVWEDDANTLNEVAEIIDVFNRNNEALIPSKAAGHFRSVSRQQALNRIWYMSKAPLRDMHAFPSKRTGSYKTKKRTLRPGQAVLLHNIMSHITIPDLCVSNFSGDEIAEGAKSATIAMVEQREQERLNKNYRLNKGRQHA